MIEPSSPSPKTFKIAKKRPSTGAQSKPILEDPSPISPFDCPSMMNSQVKIKKVQSQESLYQSKTTVTRPSTSARSTNSFRPKSISSSRNLLTETSSPIASPKSPFLLQQRQIMGQAEPTPYSIISLKSASPRINNLLTFYDSRSELQLNFLRKNEEIIQDIIQFQQKDKSKSQKSHRRVVSMNDRAFTERSKLQNLEDKILPTEGDMNQKSPTIKEFVHQIREKIDFSQRRDTRDILRLTTNREKTLDYLVKIGIASPKSFRDKAMFENYGNEIEDVLMNNASKLRGDIMNKKWTVAPTRKKTKSEPFMFSRSFNMKKFCEARGIKSITDALKSYHDRAWDVVLNEPHNIENYMENGDGEAFKLKRKNTQGSKPGLSRAPTDSPRRILNTERTRNFF